MSTTPGGLRSDRLAWVLIVAATVVRVLFVAEIVGHGVDLRPCANVDSYGFDYDAKRIASGDVLSRTRVDGHSTASEPGIHGFGAAILGKERFDAEYGPFTFTDYPGYTYLVAAFYRVFGTGTLGLAALLGFQEALDVVACAFTYEIARRLLDRTVARAALALVAFDGPLVFYAGFVLRDSVITSLFIIIVGTALRAGEPERPARAWLPVGLLAGAAWLVKGTTLVLLPFLLPALVVRGDRRRTLERLAFALAGAALVVAPFAARNVALGVPPLRMTTFEATNLLVHDTPGAGTRGLSFDLAEARRAAERCPRLTNLSALATAVREHPTPLGWPRLVAARIANSWIADDPWDNVREQWLAPCLRATRLTPVRFKLIAPFALIGLVLALAQGARALPLLGPVAVTLVMAGLGCCLARYRLNADHVHALLAASAFVWLLREARRKRSRALFVALGAVALSLALHDDPADPRWRPPSRDQVAGYVLGTFSLETSRYLLGNL